jgi:hypothetical protein
MPPNPVPIPSTRIRKQDEFLPTSQIKRQCRSTTVIGETQFRCDLHHQDGLTVHHEAGIMGGKVRYEITWEELATPLRIRDASNRRQQQTDTEAR